VVSVNTGRFDLFVPGRPVPQGSKTAFISKSTGRPMVKDNDVRLPQWRMKVTAAAMEAIGSQSFPLPIEGGVGMTVDFILERPKNHFGSGRNAEQVKESAPTFPATMPDIDKLLRAILDALTDAQVWKDDGQVVWVQARKVYALPGHTQPGVHIVLGRMD
jgi:Holliday junction resolvase RusA-like endonuclease